jgi:hypothetical protein
VLHSSSWASCRFKPLKVYALMLLILGVPAFGFDLALELTWEGGLRRRAADCGGDGDGETECGRECGCTPFRILKLALFLE